MGLALPRWPSTGRVFPQKMNRRRPSGRLRRRVETDAWGSEPHNPCFFPKEAPVVGGPPHPVVSAVTELEVADVAPEMIEELERFSAWKDKLVEDPNILGGEPVFPMSHTA